MAGFFKRLLGLQDTVEEPRAAMDERTYRAVLSDILADNFEAGAERLRSLFEVLPEKVRGVDITIHAGQEQDGMFTILVHLSGPDLYALNQSVEEYRYLYQTVKTPRGGDADIFMLDHSELDFAVNDAIVDEATAWIEGLWAECGGDALGVQASVMREDGFGLEVVRPLAFAAVT